MRRAIVLAVVLLLGCALAPVACDDSGSECAVPPGWATFEGEYLSLALPDSFKGGDLADPEVIATLEEIAARNPDAAIAEALGTAVHLMATDSEAHGQLVMWSEPNADGTMSSVTAERATLPDGMSLKAWIGNDMGEYPDADWTVENVTEDQAYVVQRFLAWEYADETTLVHRAYRVVGPYVYTVKCTFDYESNTALDAIFRASAETIALNEQ